VLHEKSETRLKLFRQPFGDFDEKLRKCASARCVAIHLLDVDTVDLANNVHQDCPAVEVQREFFHGFGHRDLTGEKNIELNFPYFDIFLF
jgi:hypothetical protein